MLAFSSFFVVQNMQKSLLLFLRFKDNNILTKGLIMFIIIVIAKHLNVEILQSIFLYNVIFLYSLFFFVLNPKNDEENRRVSRTASCHRGVHLQGFFIVQNIIIEVLKNRRMLPEYKWRWI